MKRGSPLPRRTPLRSKSGLSRSTPLPRETPIRKRNAKRKGSRFPKRRDPAYCAWIRERNCLVAGTPSWIDGARDCAGRIECAHVRSRGAGGDDVGNTVPLCTRHHREQHAIGIRSFEARYGVNLGLNALLLGALQPPDLPFSGSPASPGSEPHKETR